MAPPVLFEDRETLDDGTRYEMIATKVAKSEDYPEGVKYRFQYMDENGRTLLRLDNFPHHPDVDRHHCHDAEGVHDVEYGGLADHVRRFYDAIDARGEW